MWFLLTLIAAMAADTRDTYDGHGRLTDRLTLEAGVLVEEVHQTYDADGNMAQKSTTKGGVTTIERYTYDKKGRETLAESSVDGVVTRHIATMWEDGQKILVEVVADGVTSRTRTTYDGDGRPITEVAEGAEGATTTTTTYDADGHVASRRTVGPDGTVLSASSATWEKPVVPILLGLSGGVGYQTDVDLLTLSGGFSIARKPSVEQYGRDPLEIGASIDYNYGRSRGVVVNNQLHAHFGIDLNLVAPRTTPFLFIDVQRNPVFNQNLDLQAVPVGVKFELVPRDIMKLDFSLAPLLNYRSIHVPTDSTIDCDGASVTGDANCDTFKVRGSFRLRMGYEADRWEIADTVEFLPNFTTRLKGIEALDKDSIVRNTFGFSFAVTSWLRFHESLVFTRDPTLAAQADCTADPGQLLCDGITVQNQAGLTFTWKVSR